MLAAGVTAFVAWQGGHRSPHTAATLRGRSGPALPVAPPGAPPVTDVTYEPVSPKTAIEINRAVPLQNAGPAALPFVIAAGTPNFERASRCLTQAIYYEAGFEPADGKRAVAQVVLNRVRSPAFPNSVCGVVYQGAGRPTGCQFTFTCDGSLNRLANPRAWESARDIAMAALRGSVFGPIGHATHYHANYVVPYWAGSMAKVGVIGAHYFYRWPGQWRPATYFSQAYASAEPVFGPASEPAPAALATAGPSVPEIPLPRSGLIPSEGPYSAARAASRAGASDERAALADSSDDEPSPGPEGANHIVALSAGLRGGKLKPVDGPK